MAYRTNSEHPVSNQAVHQNELYRKRKMHQQRLAEISMGGRRGDLGNRWLTGPNRSRPTYAHLDQNLKKVQVEAERFDRIEHENRILLEKMSALMASNGVVDPTEGTWEFQPGVRLNKHQMPVIDHGISHQPTMPQRGAAREPESMNWGSRRRELERITQENRGIVYRIQDRKSYYPASQWVKRSQEHDEHLMLIRKPASANTAFLQAPPSPLLTAVTPAGTSRGGSGVGGSAGASRSSKRKGGNGKSNRSLGGRDARSAQVSVLLSPTKEGDAHLLVGLASGFVSGVTLTISPDEMHEENVTVYETWLRKDGLVLILKDPTRSAHPAGATVLLDAAR